jgi:hypothetical protein
MICRPGFIAERLAKRVTTITFISCKFHAKSGIITEFLKKMQIFSASPDKAHPQPSIRPADR